MAVITQKDTLKLQITRRNGLILMIFVSLILVFIIISNIYWLLNYDIKTVTQDLINQNKEPSVINMNAYVRIKVIFTIVGNTLIIGLFQGIIWWSISKKRLGLGFGLFWIIIFGINAIATPFYTVQIDVLTIILIILHTFISIILLFWLTNLIAYRQRLRQEIARKRGANG